MAFVQKIEELRSLRMGQEDDGDFIDDSAFEEMYINRTGKPSNGRTCHRSHI